MSCCDGFRLAAPSECSMRSKARIDALFEDSRSVCSSSWCTSTSLVPRNVGCCTVADEEQQRRVNSAVQARIEAMFASVEAESSTPGECAAAVLPVKYMGAAPVGGRVASVRGLQEPLRQLAERIGDSVSAELEVSRRGLTYRTSELHEKNNPFRRIAVWSALKLQTRRRPNSNNAQDLLHAFVPLVADETSLATNNEDRHADLFRTMRGLAKDVEDYPPIFAVVMRRPGAARLLECHAFACRCEEDAIAAAATLYRALLADLDATARRPRQNNGLGCVSLASVVSSTRETSPTRSRRCSIFRESRPGHVVVEKVPPPPPPPPLHHPVRPPRSKKSSISSVNTEDEHSSSTTCTPTNVSVVIEKAGRPRKKKNSDVKAEDVLEARHRRISSTKDSNESKSLSSSPSSNEQTSQERRMNAKNKSFGSRTSQCQASTEEVQVIEKMYEGNKSSSSDRGNSCDFGFSNENSIYESTRIYAKACIAEMKKNDQRIYEAARPSNSSSTTSSSTLRRDSYSSRPPQPTPFDMSSNHNGQRRRNVSSSRQRDHFRDVDKICSLGTGEAFDGKSSYRKKSIKKIEDRLHDVKRSNRSSAPSIRSTSTSEHSSRSKRLNRVSTMDRPLRKSSLDVRKHPPSLTQSHHQQKLQQHQQQRRRSRAGSEPPTSRTELAAAQTAALLKRSQSDVDVDKGDLLTRVELPRRGSFLKPGSLRKRDGIEGGNGGTPLGFTELFDEFRNQEGLTSVDDILAAIIDPEGMSFNDLKPLYKEFLLKLAATLTQDELYQRSASIMRRRRRPAVTVPQRRRSSRASNRPACLLRRAIKRSVSRLKSSSSAPTEFTSIIYPARKLNDRGSYGSSSSCDVTKAGQHRHKNGKVLASKLVRRRSTTRCSSSKSRIGHTTSEDSDTCRRANRSLLAANRSSSGYVSCSECSYDSESCTCVSADKCYCSLSRSGKTPQDPQPTIPAAAPMSLCSCDTDSCSESNKCYCARKSHVHRQQHQKQPSILEQLRQKGIVPSESTLSRGASPDRTKRSRNGSSKCLASSKSLEYLRVRSSTIRGSVDNLALDYDLFRPGGNSRRRSSQCSSGSEKVLVVSARDPQGRLIYVGGTERGDVKGSSRRGQSKKSRKHGNSVPGHHEALSIKKSAEIAAVFGGGQHHRLGRRTSSASSLRSSISLEAGLGYLP